MPYNREFNTIMNIIEKFEDDPEIQAETLIYYLLPKKQAESVISSWRGEILSRNEKRNLSKAQNKAQAWFMLISFLRNCDKEEDLELAELKKTLLEN